jgi:hypothetical protein
MVVVEEVIESLAVKAVLIVSEVLGIWAGINLREVTVLLEP